MAQPTRTRIYAEEYYALTDYDKYDLIELIDGEVFIGVPPIPVHQRIVREVLFLLTSISRQTGGEAFTSPIEVFLDDLNIVEPDVLYLKLNSRCVVGEKQLTGAPDLVIEVLSPSTAKVDRGAKYAAYEQHGVGEYWIIDPTHGLIEVWILGATGTFVRSGAFAPGDSFTSATLGVAVDVKAVLSSA